MKLLLEIEEDKAAFFMELLRNFQFVKVEKIYTVDEVILTDLKEAVKELNLVKQSKKEAQTLNDFLNELYL